MTINRKGCHRIVILAGPWAFKIPNFLDDWRLFLTGLLANMQERQLGRTGWPELCPVLWSIPGGWLVVMPRAREMTEAEFEGFDCDAFAETPDYVVPVENKPCSFGWVGERLVAIDYGS